MVYSLNSCRWIFGKPESATAARETETAAPAVMRSFNQNFTEENGRRLKKICHFDDRDILVELKRRGYRLAHI